MEKEAGLLLLFLVCLADITARAVFVEEALATEGVCHAGHFTTYAPGNRRASSIMRGNAMSLMPAA